jgi:hypothetical protein
MPTTEEQDGPPIVQGVSALPGVRLSFTRSGVSTTIGVPSASIHSGGGGGPRTSLGIPGPGPSIRTPLREPRKDTRPNMSFRDAAAPNVPSQKLVVPSVEMEAIQSEAASGLTIEGLAPLRDLIFRSQQERHAADKTVTQANAYQEAANKAVTDALRQHDLAERNLARLESSRFRRFRKDQIGQTRTELEQSRSKLEDANIHLAKSRGLVELAERQRAELFLDIDFGLSGNALSAWTRLSAAFEGLGQSKRIWDITASRDKRAGVERKTATRMTDRKAAHLSISELAIIGAHHKALQWHNANGGDLFIYPGFIIVFQTDGQFAILSLSDVKLEFRPTNFQEQEPCPSDARQVGTTWAYANRDGSRDERYADNRQIPIVLYAELHWTSETGLYESFMFSNVGAAAAFSDALGDFRNALASS